MCDISTEDYDTTHQACGVRGFLRRSPKITL
jgi:hypothetical protein